MMDDSWGERRSMKMHPMEFWGRILLAAAVGLLFIVVFISTVTGGIIWPAVIPVLVIGVVGAVGLALGSGRG
jgi:hypothetical protein